jgi:hypothetical protein
MHKFGLRVHAPMNWTTFLWRTFRMMETSCEQRITMQPLAGMAQGRAKHMQVVVKTWDETGLRSPGETPDTAASRPERSAKF